MDVETMMALRAPIIIAIAAVLLPTAACQKSRTNVPVAPEPLVIGAVHLSLQPQGTLSVVGSADGDVTLDLGLPYPETNDFVRWVGTNVVHLERYYDAWIVLVQCHRKVDTSEADPRFGCDTQYKALIVRDDGKVFLNPESNGGTGCPPIDRDRHEFTYLADKFVHTEGLQEQ
jgi:hypothetical protein